MKLEEAELLLLTSSHESAEELADALDRVLAVLARDGVVDLPVPDGVLLEHVEPTTNGLRAIGVVFFLDRGSYCEPIAVDVDFEDGARRLADCSISIGRQFESRIDRTRTRIRALAFDFNADYPVRVLRTQGAWAERTS